MASVTENVNTVSMAIAKITNDPAERFSIASVLVEMYRYEMNKQFIPLEDKKSNA